MGDAASVLGSVTPDYSMPPGATGPTVPLQQLQPPGMQDQPPQQQPQQQPPQQYQTTPASQDPEVVAGAAHQSWLAHIMDTVSNILGGDTTLHVTKHPDGTVEVTHDPSTTGEKWGRIAQAALGGAAKGMEVGQGPGGPARAAAGGIQTGMAQPQQRLDAANKDAEAQQQIMERNANNALLNQRIVAGAWNNLHLDRDDLQKQEDIALDHATKLRDAGFTPLAMGVKDSATLAKYGAANPLAVGAHMGAGGDMIYNEPDGKGGVNFYQLSADSANQPTTEPTTTELRTVDPDDPTKTISKPFTIPAGTKKGALATQLMALNVANDNAIKQANEAKMTKQERDTQQGELALKQKAQPSEIAEKQATAANQWSEAKIHQTQQKILQGGATAAGAAGLHGDAYLQASGLDPSTWQLIKATANGDVKMPTASRSPANIAFRQQVMNYDPTFTDARYDTKQNFKTKGDATNLQTLSTSLEHAENAQKNSAKLGNSPSLLTGRNLSGDAAAYNQDVQLLNEEIGKLVKGGVMGEHELDSQKQNMLSPVQSIRDKGISETLELLGGRVRAGFQKYKTGAQQELPVEQYFDQPTQARLNRYGITQQQPGGGGAGAGQGAGAGGPATPPPINLIPPGHDVSFKNHGGIWRNVNGVAQKVGEN